MQKNNANDTELCLWHATFSSQDLKNLAYQQMNFATLFSLRASNRIDRKRIDIWLASKSAGYFLYRLMQDVNNIMPLQKFCMATHYHKRFASCEDLETTLLYRMLIPQATLTHQDRVSISSIACGRKVIDSPRVIEIKKAVIDRIGLYTYQKLLTMISTAMNDAKIDTRIVYNCALIETTVLILVNNASNVSVVGKYLKKVLPTLSLLFLPAVKLHDARVIELQEVIARHHQSSSLNYDNVADLFFILLIGQIKCSVDALYNYLAQEDAEDLHYTCSARLFEFLKYIYEAPQDANKMLNEIALDPFTLHPFCRSFANQYNLLSVINTFLLTNHNHAIRSMVFSAHISDPTFKYDFGNFTNFFDLEADGSLVMLALLNNVKWNCGKGIIRVFHVNANNITFKSIKDSFICSHSTLRSPTFQFGLVDTRFIEGEVSPFASHRLSTPGRISDCTLFDCKVSLAEGGIATLINDARADVFIECAFLQTNFRDKDDIWSRLPLKDCIFSTCIFSDRQLFVVFAAIIPGLCSINDVIDFKKQYDTANTANDALKSSAVNSLLINRLFAIMNSNVLNLFEVLRIRQFLTHYHLKASLNDTQVAMLSTCITPETRQHFRAVISSLNTFEQICEIIDFYLQTILADIDCRDFFLPIKDALFSILEQTDLHSMDAMIDQKIRGFLERVHEKIFNPQLGSSHTLIHSQFRFIVAKKPHVTSVIIAEYEAVLSRKGIQVTDDFATTLLQSLRSLPVDRRALTLFLETVNSSLKDDDSATSSPNNANSNNSQTK